MLEHTSRLTAIQRTKIERATRRNSPSEAETKQKVNKIEEDDEHNVLLPFLSVFRTNHEPWMDLLPMCGHTAHSAHKMQNRRAQNKVAHSTEEEEWKERKI